MFNTAAALSNTDPSCAPPPGIESPVVTDQRAAPLHGSKESAPTVVYDTSSTLGGLGEEFFAPITDGVAHEGAMLHPSLREIAASFARREGVVARDLGHGGRPIGYVRLEPLLSDALRERLSLPDLFPTLFEAGTMFVSPEGRFRGQGHLSRMCATLLGEYREEIHRGEMLILGTTKDLRVLRALDDGGLLTFVPVHHLTFPHLAAFTCICDGEMGRGYQFGATACPSRLDSRFQGGDLTLESLPRVGSTIPCTMFVNSIEVATAAERTLAHRFGALPGDSVEALRMALLSLGHYPADPRHVSESRVDMTVENRPYENPHDRQPSL